MQHSRNIDISRIIKRLELIKSLIALEEEMEINAHVSKLRESAEDPEINLILSFIELKEYSRAMSSIKTFINQHYQLKKYVDPEIEGLQLEVKSLAEDLNKLSVEKADLEKLIHEFGVRHNNELGELILKVLHFKRKKAKGTPTEYEANKDYSEYSREYEISKADTLSNLSDEELKELKQKYRKASKICHPDVVSNDQKHLAEKIFAELYNAYERNDLNKVCIILENLEKGDFFVSKSDFINEKKLMKAEIENLRLRINELKEQCRAILESEAYKTIIDIGDWDTYFEYSKQKLTEQINEFENGK